MHSTRAMDARANKYNLNRFGLRIDWNFITRLMNNSLDVINFYFLFSFFLVKVRLGSKLLHTLLHMCQMQHCKQPMLASPHFENLSDVREPKIHKIHCFQ